MSFFGTLDVTSVCLCLRKKASLGGSLLVRGMEEVFVLVDEVFFQGVLDVVYSVWAGCGSRRVFRPYYLIAVFNIAARFAAVS